MANWRKTRTPSVYVAHATACPANADPKARCRCDPSYRGPRAAVRGARRSVARWRRAGPDRPASVNRYVKLLPQPGEDDAADRLNAYLKRAKES
jgi:hypothetical protein